MMKNWRERLAYWLLGEQHAADLQIHKPFKKLPVDLVAEAYSTMYHTPVIRSLLENLIALYDKQIVELADFSYTPVDSPNNLLHHFLYKFVQIKGLKTRRNLLAYFLKNGKKYEHIIKMKEWQEKKDKDKHG